MLRVASSLRFMRALFLLAALPRLGFGTDLPIPTPPTVDARAYLVVDYHTGKTLAALDPDARMEPASLTKLMTAYLVFQELAAEKLKLQDQVMVSEHAWRSEGSRTFIELGKPVSVELLIFGMIVQSGNDATIALAERIAGTEGTFAQLMNANAKRLGMAGTHFENSTGLPSPHHYTTAHDLSLLAFEYNGIKQQNRNGLLGRDAGIDGLKTGHTDAAGFCLVTSALRDGMRVVSVVLGAKTFKGREVASGALVNYAFAFYDTKLLAKGGTKLASAPVYKAAATPVGVGVSEDVYVTLPRSAAGEINTTFEVQPRLIAPLARSANVGVMHAVAAGQAIATVPLHPLADVPQGGWWRRLIDTVRLWFA